MKQQQISKNLGRPSAMGPGDRVSSQARWGFGTGLFLLSLAAVAPTAAAAQVVQTVDEPAMADEILVVGSRAQFRVVDSNSATKLPLDVTETPQALTIISDELIRAANIRSSLDLADYVVGVEKAGQGDGTLSLLTARGFPIDTERGYKINGLAVDSEVDIDYGLIERVEVVRGPASMLYGDSDYGATINRQLKMPTRDLQAVVAGEYASFDSYRFEGDVGGPLAADGKLGARLAVVAGETGGATDFTNEKRIGISATLAYDLGASSRLSLAAVYQHSDGRYSDGLAVLPDGTIDGLPFQNFAGADSNRSRTDIVFVSGEFKTGIGDQFDLIAKLGYSDIRFLSRASLIINVGQFPEIFPDGVPVDDNGNPVDGLQFDGQAPLFAFGATRNRKNLSADVTGAYRFQMFGQENIFAVSVDYRRQERRDLASPFSFLGLTDVFANRPYQTSAEQRVQLASTEDVTDQTLTIYGASPQLVLRPAPWLTALVGLRWTRAEQFNARANPAKGVNEATTLRAGLVFTINPAIRPYASYSEGIVFNAGLLTRDLQNVKPERGKQFEIGVKGEFAQRRAGYSLAAFRIERVDGAVFSDFGLDGAPDVYENIGRQINQGFEAEINGTVLPGFNLNASYAYTDVNIEEDSDPGRIGQTPPNVPKHSVKLFGIYAFARESSFAGLTIGGGITHRSSVEADSYGALQLPSYTRFDVRASYDVSDRLVIEAEGSNLTDALALNSTYGDVIYGLKYFDPRSFRVRATYKF